MGQIKAMQDTNDPNANMQIVFDGLMCEAFLGSIRQYVVNY